MQVQAGDVSDLINRIGGLVEEINDLRDGKSTSSLCVHTGVEKKLVSAGSLLVEAVGILREKTIFINEDPK